MIKDIITPEEAKRARTLLYLPQRKIAESIGINRSQYALFEVNRYIFTDKEQLRLKKYFESKGYTFPERQKAKKPPAPPSRVIRNIAVPNRISDEKANTTLNQIAQNDQYIQSKAQETAELHWFTEEPKSEEANKLLELMAYNYCHLRYLMGLNSLCGSDFAEDLEPEQTTHGALVNQRLFR